MRIHSTLIVQPARCFVADVISVHHRICPSSHCRIAQSKVYMISEKALGRIKRKQNRRDSSRAKEMYCIPYRQTAPFSLPLFM